MNEAGTPPTKEVRTAAAPKRAQALRRGFGIALLVAALVALGRLAGGRVPEFAAWVEGLGWWAPAAFIVAFFFWVLVRRASHSACRATGARSSGRPRGCPEGRY